MAGTLGPEHGDVRRDADVVLEVMGSTRAMRHLRTEPVPVALVDELLWASTRAASPNNTQLWHYVVLTDPERRRRLAAVLARFERWIDRMPAPVDRHDARTRRSSRQLLASLGDAPVLVAVCGEDAYPPGSPDPAYLWATLGGAAQNLLVAARALGLGAALTMFHVVDEAAVAEVLQLPDGVRVGSIIPVGWPGRLFGAVRRRPMSEVVHREHW